MKLDKMGGSGKTRKGWLLRNFCSLPGDKEKRVTRGEKGKEESCLVFVSLS